MSRDTVYLEVEAERLRQERKWGPSEDRPVPSLSILMEEVGEVAQSRNERDFHNARTELIQVAAVAVAMVEGLDRGDGRI